MNKIPFKIERNKERERKKYCFWWFILFLREIIPTQQQNPLFFLFSSLSFSFHSILQTKKLEERNILRNE